MKFRIITSLTFVFLMVVGLQTARTQSADPAITGAVFVPDSISTGEVSELQISFVNSGFSDIPANSIELTIDAPQMFYSSGGATAPAGPGGALFSWTYTMPDVWVGTNIAAIPMQGGGMIMLDVTGIAESSAYEITNVNVQPIANFSDFVDISGNNNESPGLLITDGCPNPTDSDGDGITDCDEIANMTGVDDPCDPNPAAVPTGDCDMDGNPNSTDPNITSAETEEDIASGESTVPTMVDILANDDFLPGINTSIDIAPVGSGTTAMGTIAVDPLTGILTYTGLETEEGTTVEIEYTVCNTAATPDPVCATEIVEFTVTDGCPNAFDSDGDGLTDCEEETGIDDTVNTPNVSPAGTSSPTDPCDPNPSAVASGDCDGDGNPNGTDPNDDMPFVMPDSTEVLAGQPVTIDLLFNDDFLPGLGITIDVTQQSGDGTFSLDEPNGMLTYNSVASDGGKDVTFEYTVCNTNVMPAVCATSTVMIKVGTGQCISGIVFFDTTVFGELTLAGDTLVAGVGVELFDSLGMEIDSVTTDATGAYKFSNAADGEYYVRFDRPAGFGGFTPDSLGTDPTLASYVTSASGNTDVFTVAGGDIENLNAGLLLCENMNCKPINVSIFSNTCMGEITPSMILTTPPQFPDSLYVITITGPDGQVKTDNIFDLDDTGQVFDVEITNPCGGSCWAPALVEYKTNPTIECPQDVTLSCAAAYNDAPAPMVTSKCVAADSVLVSEEEVIINNATIYSQLIRKWVAEDIYGNTSDTCTQNIFIEQPDLTGITFPANTQVNCADNYATVQPSGYPAPSVTGVPVQAPNNTPLYPLSDCNTYSQFTDELHPSTTDCKTVIVRTWEIGDWNQPTFITFPQVIEIVDNEGPTVTCPADMTVSTGSFSCEYFDGLPLPTATDACNANDIRIDLSITSMSGFMANYNGTPVILPVGEHTLTYQVYDGCDNLTECTFDVTVQDNSDPIAVCNDTLVVGIALDTTSFVYATSLNNGSFDECGNVTIGIARMDTPGFPDPSVFSPKASVYCSDIMNGEVMMGLLVTDMSGNTNMCMGSVKVEDKVEGQITDVPDITVPCDFAYDDDSLSLFFGATQIFDNCPDNNYLVDVLLNEPDACGGTTVTRRIQLFNSDDQLLDTEFQNITFDTGDQLTMADITFPGDILVTGCYDDLANIVPPMPTVASGKCQQLAWQITNDTSTVVNGACLSIERTFSIVNWCAEPGTQGSIDDPFVGSMNIKLENNDKPYFENVFADTTFQNQNSLDCNNFVIAAGILSAEAHDTCSADVDLIDSFKVYIDGTNTLVNSGAGLDAAGTYDLGDYRVDFQVEDGCGNSTLTSSTFSIINTKKPVPYAKTSVVANIGQMTFNGTTVPAVMINIDSLDLGSYHPCGGGVDISFAQNQIVTLDTLYCDDGPDVELEFWVTSLLNGEQDFVTINLTLQDNNTPDLCTQFRVAVEGRIYTEADAELKNAEVELISSESLLDMTDEEGQYAFPDMPTGGNYKLEPTKDDDHLNGVSTIDLVMIQRHILEIAPLDSPYEIIAADINNSESLTASDLVALRKVILGVDATFENNTSWRFIDEGHTFSNESNPWESEIPEDYIISGLSSDMNIDFIAVKTGDVNGDVTVNLFAGATAVNRGTNTLTLNLPESDLTAGNTYRLPVHASDALDFYGMQYTLKTEGLQIVNVEPAILDINFDNMAAKGNLVNFSYANGSGVSINENDHLFTLVVKPFESGEASDMIEISHKGIAAEMYSGESIEVGDIAMEWRSDDNTSAVEEMLLIAESNVPNPWSTQTEIRFYLPEDGKVDMKVMDANGRVILVRSQKFRAGNQKFVLTDREIDNAGLLIYELRYGNQIINDKMIKIK